MEANGDASAENPILSEAERRNSSEHGSLQGHRTDARDSFPRDQHILIGHSSLPRSQFQSNQPRGQGSLTRQGVGSLTRGQVPTGLLPAPSDVCRRDTRIFTALFIVLLVVQVVHSCCLSYRNVASSESMDEDTQSGMFIAIEVLFPLLIAIATVPSCVWLIVNVWDCCKKDVWNKFKRGGGFIAYHLSVILSTLLYVSYIIYLMARSYNTYLDKAPTDAACYCMLENDTALGLDEYFYQCRCHVPEEVTPWLLSSREVYLIEDTSLQNRGSNYSGPVIKMVYNSSETLHTAEVLYYAGFKKLVYYMELCILTIALRVMGWGWTSEYGGRDMSRLDASITVPYLYEHRKALLYHSLYCLLEGVDLYTLLTTLMDHATDMAVQRPAANGIMAVIGLGSFVIHCILPLAFVRLVPSVNSQQAKQRNKLLVFISSMPNMILVMKVVAVMLNVMMLIIRVLLFKWMGGLDSMIIPNLFLLFLVKEFYVIGHRGSEFFIEWWDLQKDQHYDDE